MPAPVAYEWNGFSVGAGIGVGWFDQDAHGDAWRKDEVKRKECTNLENGKERVKEKCWKWKRVQEWSISAPKSAGYRSQLRIGLSSSSNDDDWNFFGTVQVGYDHLLGNRFLVGAFADFDFYKDADAHILRK